MYTPQRSAQLTSNGARPQPPREARPQPPREPQPHRPNRFNLKRPGRIFRDTVPQKRESVFRILQETAQILSRFSSRVKTIHGSPEWLDFSQERPVLTSSGPLIPNPKGQLDLTHPTTVFQNVSLQMRHRPTRVLTSVDVCLRQNRVPMGAGQYLRPNRAVEVRGLFLQLERALVYKDSLLRLLIGRLL